MKKKATHKAPPKSRAEKLLDAVKGNTRSGPVTHRKPWEPTEIQWAWYVLWTAKMWSIRKIAVHANRNHKTVRDVLLRCQEWEWDALTEERVSIAKRQTRALEDTYDLASTAFARSQENAVTIKTEEITVDGMNFDMESVSVPAVKTTRTEAGQAGDPSFLTARMTALKGIRDIWGVEAPKESKVIADLNGGLSTDLGDSRDETIRLHLEKALEEWNAGSGSPAAGKSS
jgi:hypothetical protein